MIQSISKNETFTCEGIWFFKITCRFFLMLVSIPPKCTNTNLVGGFYLWRKCWNSAFNAQGSRVSIVTVHVRAVKTYVTGKDRMKLSLPPKLSYFVFVRFSFPVTHLMAYYARNWPISPPDHLTLLITLALERKKPWVKTFYRIWIGLQ